MTSRREQFVEVVQTATMPLDLNEIALAVSQRWGGDPSRLKPTLNGMWLNAHDDDILLSVLRRKDERTYLYWWDSTQTRAPENEHERSHAVPSERVTAAQASQLEARIVRTYLNALRSPPPTELKRQQTAEQIKRRLIRIEEQLIGTEDMLRVLDLVNEQVTLRIALDEASAPTLEQLEDDFVSIAASYTERKSISYAALRAVGVSAATLKRAGISPTTNRSK